MKNILVINNAYSCCFEKASFLEYFIGKHLDLNSVDDIKDADCIIYAGNCAANFDRIEYAIEELEYCIENKKDDAKIIVTGCIARPLDSKYDTIKKLNDVLSQVDYVFDDNTIPNIINILDLKVTLYNDDAIYGMRKNSIKANFAIGDGCTHKCSFCKSNYMDFKPKSVDKGQVFQTLDEMAEKGIKCVHLLAPNLTQYGIDLYGKSALKDVLAYARRIEDIKWLMLQELCVRDLIENENLLQEIANNKKIKFIDMQILSGSNKILKLMNRGYNIDDVKYVVNTIRKTNPEMYFATSIMSSFPTEDINDIESTVELIKDLDIGIEVTRTYENSEGVPASNYPQFSNKEQRKHLSLYKKLIGNYNDELNKKYDQLPLLVDHVTKKRVRVIARDKYIGYIPMESERVKVLKRKPIVGEEI